jgi:hypothetical protein
METPGKAGGLNCEPLKAVILNHGPFKGGYLVRNFINTVAFSVINQINTTVNRHSRESGNPVNSWIPGRAKLARNDEF